MFNSSGLAGLVPFFFFFFFFGYKKGVASLRWERILGGGGAIVQRKRKRKRERTRKPL